MVFIVLWLLGFLLCTFILAWCVEKILDTYVGRKEL